MKCSDIVALCHGEIHQEEIMVTHAWIEYAVSLPGCKGILHQIEMVRDLTMPEGLREMPKHYYFELFGIQEEQVKRYGADEVVQLYVETKHFGPWDDKILQALTRFYGMETM
ncbi:MAG: hypothetical protein ACPGYT_11755 [Nitrospirales bacterium]